MNSIRHHFIEAQDLLTRINQDDAFFSSLESAGAMMLTAIKQHRKLMSCGNGGSMCDAMHFAEELTGRYRNDRVPIAAIAISDPSHISCVSNDYGYDDVFSRMIYALGNEGDVLVAISTSGNSKNIIKAAIAAKERQMKIVGLTGKDGGQLASLCDVEIRVPWPGYADRIQEVHIKVIHALIDHIEKGLK